MSNAKIIGFVQSSYVMTARAAAAIKGVAVDFVPITPGDNRKPDHLARHPWGKTPTFEHGDVRLFETDAITRYIDEVFDGPSLVPSSAAARARMTQWISVVNCYVYPHIVPAYVLKYVFAGEEGPERAAIDAAVPAIEQDLEVISKSLGDDAFLVDNELTIADLFLAPLILGLGRFPEGKTIVDGLPALGRLAGAVLETPGFSTVLPSA